MLRRASPQHTGTLRILAEIGRAQAPSGVIGNPSGGASGGSCGEGGVRPIPGSGSARKRDGWSLSRRLENARRETVVEGPIGGSGPIPKAAEHRPFGPIRRTRYRTEKWTNQPEPSNESAGIDVRGRSYTEVGAGLESISRMTGRSRTSIPPPEPNRNPSVSDPQHSIEGDPANAEDVRPMLRRDVLGSALRAMAIGGIASAGLIGCATTTRRTGSLPDPDLPGSTAVAGGSRRRMAAPAAPEVSAGMAGVLARSQWTTSRPNYRGMEKQQKLRAVTIHHDGLGKALGTSGITATKARLTLIRNSHVGRSRNWADIGYHYAIDRGGRIWECRPLGYQGAHVRGHNDGNIGILVMGDFDLERPSNAQLRALGTHVNALCLSFGIDKGRGGVKTHKEWASANTACPGRYLQPKVNSLRANGFRV